MSETTTGGDPCNGERDLLAELRDYLLATMPKAVTEAAAALEPVRDLASSDGRLTTRGEAP